CHGTRRGEQARAIAAELKETFNFPSGPPVLQDDYGNAILSVHPMKLIKAATLPTLPGRVIERRGAIWASVDLHGAELHFINTHLGRFSLERQIQRSEEHTSELQ